MDRLQVAINNLKPCVERNVFSSLPTLQQIEYWIDKDFLPNQSKFENLNQIWSPVPYQHFQLTKQLESYFKDYRHDHQLYGALTDTPTAKIPHRDPMHVLITQVVGETPWRIFPKTKNLKEKSILSTLLKPGDCLVIPKGYWHAAYPNQKRIAFSTGWI